MAKASMTQLAYLVRPGGLNAALEYWVKVMGAGPFFRGVFPLINQIHHGKSTDQQAEVACGYHGDMQIELIEPTNRAAGPYNAFLDANANIPVGGLYHHVMIEEGDYDKTVARLISEGCKTAFYAENEVGDRVAYLEAFDTTGGYIEVIESAMWPAVCEKMKQARVGWDGSDPVRPFTAVLPN